MTKIDFKQLSAEPGELIVTVKGEPVWDYKFLGGALHLISEKIEGIDESEYVNVRELMEYATSYIVRKVVSETTGEELTHFTKNLENNTLNFE